MARTKTPAIKYTGSIDRINEEERQAKIRKLERIRERKRIREIKRFHNGSTEDRLSDLPDSLIVHILSLLETEDAVKTGRLSKRWVNLWTRVDKFVYVRPRYKGNEEDLPYLVERGQRERNDERWVSFIDSTLMKCTSNIIKSFSLGGFIKLPFGDGRLHNRIECLEKWVAYLLEKKVENVKLEKFYCTPPFLFQSSMITTLELINMQVNTCTTVSLTALKSLLLDSAYMADEDIGNILTGSPVLENLVIRKHKYFSSLNILSPTVKMLELWDMYDMDEVFNIKAPWLQELKISGYFNQTNFELVNVSSLLKADLTFHTYYHSINKWTLERDRDQYIAEYNDSWIPMVTKLLKSLSHVGELIISSEVIQVFLPLKLSGMPSPLFMCKYLTIETHIWKFDLPGIACLLENAPHLETLLIKLVPCSFEPKDGFLFNETHNYFQDKDLYLNKPIRKFLKLKFVKVEYCRMPCHENIKDNQGGRFEFTLAEYILKRAVVLEKLAFFSPTGWNCSDGSCLVPNCSYQYVSSLCCKLILTIMSLTGNEASGWELKRSDNVSEFVFSNYASLLSMPGSSSMNYLVLFKTFFIGLD